MKKPFFSQVEILLISFWVSFFSFNYEYYLSDSNFWFRVNNTIYSYLSYVLSRGPKSEEELNNDSNSFYEIVTIYDLGWVIFLWFLRFQMPRDFVSNIYTLTVALLQ